MLFPERFLHRGYFKRIFLLLFLISLTFYSCSKKNAPALKDKPSKNQTKTDQTTSPSAASFSVKNIGDSKSKNDYIDFSWDENGKEVKLSDFEGKVIVLNFWATWCPPCRRELPALSQISNELKDKNFKMIGISVDEKQNTVNNFLKSNSISYTILHEPTDLVMKYMYVTGVKDNVIPQTFIIDKNGKVAEAIIGSRTKEDFLKLINKYL